MVSIVILSFNTEKLLDSCLRSVYSNIGNIKHEIIVIDNASSDESVAMVQEKYKDVTVIENKENMGFAKANNMASKTAKGEYILFLNSDTSMMDDGLEKIVRRMEEDNSIGCIGGKMQNVDGSQQRSYGKFYTLTRATMMLLFGDKGETMGSGQSKEQVVEWVSGGCMLVRRDLFHKLGGFDEHFFMYIEDMEFCFRVKKSGFNVLFSPSFVVSHVGHGSSNRTFAIVHIYKGLLYFFKKHRYYGEYILMLVLLVVKAVLLVSLGTLTGNKYLTKTYKEAIAGVL